MFWKYAANLQENIHAESVISTKLFFNFIEIILLHWCSPINLLHILRAPFPKKTPRRLLSNRSPYIHKNLASVRQCCIMKKAFLLSFRNLLEMLWLTKEVLPTILNLVGIYLLLFNIAVLLIHRFILKVRLSGRITWQFLNLLELFSP